MNLIRLSVAALLSLLVLVPSVEAQSAEGRIIGRVLDARTAEPLAGVQVYVGDGSIGTLSDLNGRYVLGGVPVGSVTLSAQSLGYGTKTITGLEVLATGVTAFDFTLETRALTLSGITVTATREAGSASALMDQRRTSLSVVESVGAQEISRRPDSDAAGVAQRMTGVTVADGKFVFIRGLGERYSQTTLNGASLPSPEPEREVVPLDIFPSGFLESLTTQKSYTPDLAADFSGGAVQIKTKDFPNQFTVRFGVGSSFNSNSQFQDGFLSFGGGGRDFLGIDDGTRGQPAVVTELMGGVRSGNRLPTDPGQRIQIGEALRDTDLSFGSVSGSTPLNRAFNLSIGGRSDWRDDGELGYFFAGTYSDSYTIRGGNCAPGALEDLSSLDTGGCDEFERKWRNSAFQESTEAFATPNVDYAFSRGLRAISWGTVGNFTLKPSPNQKVSLRTTLNLSTDDEARFYQGENSEDIGGLIQSERSRWVERLMLWGQLSGEHVLFDDTQLEWRLTGARAQRDEPLMRETIYVQDPSSLDFFLLDFTESGRYFSSELIDDDFSAALDWRVPFELFGNEASVKFGGAYRQRDREFGARRLNWNFQGDQISDLDSALQGGTIVAGNAGTASEFGIDEVVEPGDVYQADDTRAAGFLMVEVPLTDRLQAVVGARVESYQLGVDSRGQSLQDADQTDVAPSLNLIFAPSTDVRLRASASRTVDRPEFRELAPFQFTEATSLRQLIGNPNLTPAEITAADLRFDWFPRPGELISVGGFYKQIDEPIEQVFIAAASTAYSYQNADKADVIGIETDVQLRLDRIADLDFLQYVTAQGNYSWIDSEVEVRAGSTFDPTSAIRPLEGQAPYVVNAGLNYADYSGFEVGFFFNRFGERLNAAGGGGVPDIYEQPRNSLDATLGFPLMGGARASVKASNLLDEAYSFSQSLNGITRLQRQYTVGRTISVGLSWEF